MTKALDQDLRTMMSSASFHNLYPILNEVHNSVFLDCSALMSDDLNKTQEGAEHFCDSLTGRVFSSILRKARALYGITTRMPLYVELSGLPLVDELRVPYRRIAVYEVETLQMLQSAIAMVCARRHNHVALFRGQNSVYFTNSKNARTAESFEQFYGGHVSEPSFLPSFLRKDFDEVTIRSIWHNQASLLLNDVAVDLRRALSDVEMKAHLIDSYHVRLGVHMDFFALGMAQHYGMPSIGLDLTDRAEVAAWFALNAMKIDSGHASVDRVGQNAMPTVFVFFCPERAVFDFRNVRPVNYPAGRPDLQHAWFGHVGWGMARNQLATYLACAFRLSPKMINDLPDGMAARMFPPRRKDPSLDAFLNQRDNPKYQGEVRRALSSLYEVVA